MQPRARILGRHGSGRHTLFRPAGADASGRHSQSARSCHARIVSHEVSSCGFWSGTAPIDYPAFYAYAYSQPPGFADVRIPAEGAFYSADFGEFILPYDRVRQSASPDDTLLEFLQSTYEAAADLAHWDRAALERRQAS